MPAFDSVIPLQVFVTFAYIDFFYQMQWKHFLQFNTGMESTKNSAEEGAGRSVVHLAVI